MGTSPCLAQVSKFLFIILPWLALSPHSSRSWVWIHTGAFLCVDRMFSLLVWILSRFSGFLPESKDTQWLCWAIYWLGINPVFQIWSLLAPKLKMQVHKPVGDHNQMGCVFEPITPVLRGSLDHIEKILIPRIRAPPLLLYASVSDF